MLTRALAIARAAGPRIVAFVRAPWGWIAATAVLAALLVVQCNGRRNAASALAVAHGEAAAVDAGVPVVHQEPDQGAVDDRAEALEHENAALRTERDRARTALGKLQAQLVIQAQTAPAVAVGPPAPPPAAGAPCPACQLLVGEQLQLGAALVVDEIPGGALIASGAIDATGPRGLLLRQPFSAPVTRAIETAPPAEPGWGFGGSALAVGREWAAGPVVAAPPWRVPLVGGRLELSAGVGYGSSFGGQVTALYRR